VLRFAGQAKVDHLDHGFPIGRDDQDVVRREVAVQDAAAVQVRQGI
jgi:hypothetical protein